MERACLIVQADPPRATESSARPALRRVSLNSDLTNVVQGVGAAVAVFIRSTGLSATSTDAAPAT